MVRAFGPAVSLAHGRWTDHRPPCAGTPRHPNMVRACGPVVSLAHADGGPITARFAREAPRRPSLVRAFGPAVLPLASRDSRPSVRTSLDRSHSRSLQACGLACGICAPQPIPAKTEDARLARAVSLVRQLAIPRLWQGHRSPALPACGTGPPLAPLPPVRRLRHGPAPANATPARTHPHRLRGRAAALSSDARCARGWYTGRTRLGFPPCGRSSSEFSPSSRHSRPVALVRRCCRLGPDPEASLIPRPEVARPLSLDATPWERRSRQRSCHAPRPFPGRRSSGLLNGASALNARSSPRAWARGLPALNGPCARWAARACADPAGAGCSAATPP
jgi:hypothetical protein